MENKSKLALFIGGIADNQTKQINETAPRLNWFGVYYKRMATIETKKLGSVEIYVLENMKSEEISRRIEIIKTLQN